MRPYTGFDEIAAGKRKGTEAFAKAMQEASGRQIWQNGSWVVRKKRGAQATGLKGMSVHATGRAADMSRRNWSGRPGCSRQDMEKVLDWLVSVAEIVGLEYLADYEYGSGGRGWRCDRDEWRVYRPGVIKGGGWGDWLHLEISNDKADTTDWVAEAMKTFPLGNHTPPAPKLDGWETCRQGDEGDNVKLAQQALADNGYKNSTGRKPIVVDGMFGPNTDRRTRQFQTDANIVVDGIFGPQTAGAIGLI